MQHQLYIKVYGAAQRLLPADFSRRYADDMLSLFEDRLNDADGRADRATLAIRETLNVAVTAAKLRLEMQQPLHAQAIVALFVLLSIIRAPDSYKPPLLMSAPVDSVDFRASDPAGEFTLHVRYGRAVGGSIDRHPVSRRQLIQTDDSIRVLNGRGRVLVAVKYNRDEAKIAWSPRPAACRGRTLSCGAEQ